MIVLVTRNTANNTMYSDKNHTLFSNDLMELHSKIHYKSLHFHKYSQYILQAIHQPFYSCTYNFYNLNIVLHHIIYRIHNYSTRIPNKPFVTSAFIN